MNSNWGDQFTIGKIFPRARKWTLEMFDLNFFWRIYKSSNFPIDQTTKLTTQLLLNCLSNCLLNYTKLTIKLHTFYDLRCQIYVIGISIMTLYNSFEGVRNKFSKQWIWTLFREVMNFQSFVTKSLLWLAQLVKAALPFQ
jgi:hypothetical protein